MKKHEYIQKNSKLDNHLNLAKQIFDENITEKQVTE